MEQVGREGGGDGDAGDAGLAISAEIPPLLLLA